MINVCIFLFFFKNLVRTHKYGRQGKSNDDYDDSSNAGNGKNLIMTSLFYQLVFFFYCFFITVSPVSGLFNSNKTKTKSESVLIHPAYVWNKHTMFSPLVITYKFIFTNYIFFFFF